MNQEFWAAKAKAREAALGHEPPHLLARGADIFKGIDASIIFYGVFNTLKMDYDWFSEWVGGDLAAAAGVTVREVKADAKIGDTLDLLDLKVTLVDYWQLDDFWYVRKAE